VKKMADYEGHGNLETAIKRKYFTKWAAEEIFLKLKGNILEIGSSIFDKLVTIMKILEDHLDYPLFINEKN